MRDTSTTDGSTWKIARRYGAALWIGLLFSTTSAPRASAADPVADRHNHHLNATSRPAGVPADYVLTHHGWFHPSCVVSVESDETVGADLVIRGRDGAAHAALTPCAQARYDRRGRKIAGPAEIQGGATPELAAPLPAAATYDGYIVYYVSSGAITSGSTLTTDWIVPPPPTNVSNQDIAFFNDILTSAGGGDILQPVLDFNGETQGKWSIESEHCCLAGNDMQTTPVVVAPGDLIRGIVAGGGCDATGVCQSWTVTTTDVTTGKSTTLNTTAPGGVPNGVSPGSLETYGVSSCDMFPVGGATTFMNNSLTGPNAAVQMPKYRLLTLQGVAAEVPTNCGYGGTASGNDYTLIYGKVTVGTDGGTPDSGGTRDASTDGKGGGGGAGGNIVADGGSADRSSVDAGRDAVAADRATGAGGGGGTNGAGGGATGTGGINGGGGGSPGTGGRSLADAGAGGSGASGSDAGAESGADAGCACRIDAASDTSPLVVPVIVWLLAVAVRRRPRRAGR